MTHEFKTPIATINLALDAIKNPKIIEDKEKVQRYLQMIKEENKRMHAQVENVLRISKLEKNELDISKEPRDVTEIIEDAIEHVSLIMEDREGVIHSHFNAQRSTILLNEVHFTNVLVNVLDNAIKYSPNVPIVDVFTENIKDFILIKIQDQGAGMSKVAQKRVFEKFYREHTGDLHNVKGHGLGLAYVKQIVEDHNGQIFVESEKGKGSTFIIKMPLINKKIYIITMEAKKILLVEDDPNFGAVLKDYLMINDFDVTLAKNGMEGFEKFKKDTFDLCILDVMMPYKDGYTLAREIREKNQEVPIIFLTAKTLKEDVLKGYKVGADDYLNKPFDSEVLLMKIKAIIQRKSTEVKPDTTKFEFEIGKFHLNSKLRFLTYPGQEPIKLSPKECELLKMLALHENDLMPRELALTKIWRDDNYFTSRSMDVYIAKLRKFLKLDENVEILNIHGEGFRLVIKK
jgi:DNA-binding response OmpR family regulator